MMLNRTLTGDPVLNERPDSYTFSCLKDNVHSTGADL